MTSNTPWLADRAFVAYSIMALAVALDLIFCWMYSGLVRGKTKTTLNAEDAVQFGTRLVDADPPEVAHVLRAWGNAVAMGVPALTIGLLYVLAGAHAGLAQGVFGLYAASRWLYTLAYLRRLQPWRTVFFSAALLCVAAMMGALAWRLLQGS